MTPPSQVLTDGTAVVPIAPRRFQRPPNLARPWKFPAGHDDTLVCRRHARSPVHIPVVISLHRPDGSGFDGGTAVIQDLSYSGLRLCEVVLAKGRLLASYFTLDLRPLPQAPGGPGVAGRILRTYCLGYPGFGIEFLLPDGAETTLQSSEPA